MRHASLLLLTCLIAVGLAALCEEPAPADATLTQTLQKRMQTLVNDAKEFKKAGKLTKARASLSFACLINLRLNSGYASPAAASLLAAVEGVNKELAEKWAEDLPQLKKKLDLIVRDQSLKDALAAVSLAGGVPIELLAGSVEDSCGSLCIREARISYLDLRRATVIQALDWLLTPFQMTWWADKGGVTAGTARRSPVDSAWVYDVSSLVAPTKDELNLDSEAQAKYVVEALTTFEKCARAELKVSDEDLCWYRRGWLLLWGSRETHQAAEKLFASLADPNAKLEGELAALHARTVVRAKVNAAAVEREMTRREQQQAHDGLGKFSFKLLAEAARGKVDLEALTELQVAWKDRARVLADCRDLPCLRSLWAVCESAGALPENQELAALAKLSRTSTQKSAQPGKAFDVPGLYALLAFRDDAEVFNAEAKAELEKQANLPDANLCKLAASLLLKRDLPAIDSRQMRGDDLVLLYALACRRLSGDTWNAFRAQAGDLLGSQPLSGGLILLVNNLSRSRLPITQSK